MGRDKAGLRLGRRTLLGQIRATARECGLPTRVIRHDRVPTCGPLGGIYTALATGRAETVLFLSCDMPFVSTRLLRAILRRFSRPKEALFVERNQRVSFPFLLRRTTFPAIGRQLTKKEFSLQMLARALHAQTLRPSRSQEAELTDINTPEDYGRALESFKRGGPGELRWDLCA
jgi:molybdopterin-guanine dinucleotide biosynthesis protein A